MSKLIPILLSTLAFPARKEKAVDIETDTDGMKKHLKRKEELEKQNKLSKRKMKKRKGKS